MLTDVEKRSVLQAVSHSAPDQSRARKSVQAALATLGTGNLRDLLRVLVRQNLLSAVQAEQLCPEHLGGSLSPEDPIPLPVLIETLGEVESQLRHFGGYRILRKIGQGGMCPVFLGYSEKKAQRVAIKILPEQQALRQSTLDRFCREAKSGSLLNHPNIVHNESYGQDQQTGQHFLVMEYVDGPSALELLEQHDHLSVGDAVHIILDIARGLEHAHSRNIIHRDVKPDNILLTGTGLAKLADLGLAKRTDENSHLTAAHQGFGTPFYMPYEQAVNARFADGRNDIYALGATLYHLVTGTVPFPGETHPEVVEKKRLGWFPPASAVNPEVPPVLEEILERSMAREPKDRYQTVSELIVALERANLASLLPSFVDKEAASADPIIRERLVAAQPTCPDLRLASVEKSAPVKLNTDIWYLRVPAGVHQWCKARVTTSQILRRLRDRKITGTAQAAHSIDGQYRPLTHYAVFRRAFRQQKRVKDLSASATVMAPEAVVSLNPFAFFHKLLANLASRWLLYLGGALFFTTLLMIGIVLLSL